MTALLPSTVRRPLAMTLLGLLGVFMTVSRGATRFDSWPWVLYGQLLLLVPLVFVGAHAFRCAANVPRQWLWLGLAGLVVAVSAAASNHPRFSGEVALLLIGGLAWTAMIAALVSAGLSKSAPAANRPPILVFARIAGALLALPLVSGLVLWLEELATAAAALGGWTAVLARLLEHRNLHPFGHMNYTAGFALLALPWLATLCRTERGGWRALWTAAVGIGTVVLVSTTSRGALLAAGVAASVYVACRLLRDRAYLRKRALPIALAVVAVGVVVAATPRLRDGLRLGSFREPHEGDVQRIAMTQGGLLLAKERPFLGHGPGLTPFVYPTVRAQLVGGVETAFQLHNGPLQLWVDHGAAGVLAALALAVVLARSALNWFRTEGAPEHAAFRPFALASALALVAYGVMFLTDYQLNLVAILAALGFHAGVVLCAPGRSISLPVTAARASGVLVFGCAAAALVLLVPSWKSRQAFWSAWWEADPTDEQAVLSQLRRAADLAPHNPNFRNHVGTRLARLADRERDAGRASLLRHEARAALEDSLALNEAQEPVHTTLAWLWLQDDPRRARTHFARAIRLLPDRSTLHLGLAFSYLATGERDAAVHALAMECLVNPFFLASPYWREPVFGALHPAVQTRLFELYRAARQHPATPRWRKAHLEHAQAFVTWWSGGDAPSGDNLKGATATARAFFAALPAIDRGHAVPSGAPRLLTRLIAAWVQRDNARALLVAGHRPPSEAAIAGALARFQANPPPASFADFLRMPAPDQKGIVYQQKRREHQLLHRMPDGEGYPDISPRPTDAFWFEFAGELFPLAGLVPGPVVLELGKP